jgi:hypothetical protein
MGESHVASIRRFHTKPILIVRRYQNHRGHALKWDGQFESSKIATQILFILRSGIFNRFDFLLHAEYGAIDVIVVSGVRS